MGIRDDGGVVCPDAHVAALTESAAWRYQALVDQVSDAIIGTSVEGIVTAWNPAAEAIYRRPAHLTLGLPIGEVVGAELDPAGIIAGGGTERATHYTGDGVALTIRVRASVLEPGYVLVCSDHTALRRAEKHFQTVVNSLNRGVVVIGMDGSIASANPAAARILDLDPIRDVSDYVALARRFQLYGLDGQKLDQRHIPAVITQHTGRPVNGRVVGLDRSDGQRMWISVSTCLLDPENPDQSGILLSFTDITAEYMVTQQLRHDAEHDPLTGLFNRASAMRRIAEALGPSGRPPLAAVMFVDLDQLKTVNDSLGHHAGDELLRTCAYRLDKVLRSGDVLARVGGDEFVAVITAPAAREDLMDIADRLHDALAEPISIDGVDIAASVSIGITMLEGIERRSVSTILRHADAAMYQAKANGRAQTRFWRT
ncbi:diguanylate cyclase (GGDEF)-like protein [Mycobacterium sp. MAA66]|uniref:diguanylate cyclase domain-containing protein n=1 Tax=Mycobacterium sp. MAA66 TaxID=3156297 RepID=UPI00351454D7